MSRVENNLSRVIIHRVFGSLCIYSRKEPLAIKSEHGINTFDGILQ